MTITHSDLKVIIIPSSSPNSTTSYQLIELSNPHTLAPAKYLIDTNTWQLLELRLFNYDNPHLSNVRTSHTVKMRDGNVVKSLVLSTDDAKLEGLVIEDARFLMATPFNFAYILIGFYEKLLASLVENGQDFKLRLLNLEDLIESLENELSTALPRLFFSEENRVLVQSIETIFEKIEENGNFYYRLSESKILQFLTDKVEKLVLNFPRSMLTKIILEKLVVPSSGPIVESNVESNVQSSVESSATPTDQSVPQNVIESAKLFHSINIVSSYTSPVLRTRLLTHYNDKFSVLEEYKKKIDAIVESQKLAQDNLMQLNASQQLERKKRPTGKSEVVPKKKQKAAVKKVQVGKGALDGFFKRA